MTVSVGELAGYTVGITAARRRKELGSALERRGARVMYGPAIRIVPLADDADTLAATRRCIEQPPDVVVVTTGIGFRGWMEAADGWGLGAALSERLDAATIVTRGPKARGSVRAAGLTEAWSPDSESTSEVLDYLLAQGVDGRRVAVQLHGEPVPHLVQNLAAAGAVLTEVPVYRWVLPDDTAPLERLLDAVVSRHVNAAVFTSAPAAASFLLVADRQGRRPEVVAALQDDVVACCVGPVTARPLQDADVPTVQPERNRLGALVREVVAQVPARCGYDLGIGQHRVQLRGHAVVIDGELVALPPAAMAVLRRLARDPGRVVGRPELLAALNRPANDEHAVEVVVARIRSALGDARLIQTVVKRGYRLAYERDRSSVAS